MIRYVEIKQFLINNLGKILISVCFLFCISSFIGQKIFDFAKRERILILFNNNVLEEASVLIDNYYNVSDQKKWGYYTFDQIKESVLSMDNMILIENEESEYDGYDYYASTGETAAMELLLPVYPNTCITFIKNPYNWITIYDADGELLRQIDYSGDQTTALYVYPFSWNRCMYIIVEYVCIYVVLFLASIIILKLLQKLLNIIIEKNYLNWFLYCFHPLWIFVGIAVFNSLYLVCLYSKRPEWFQVSEAYDAYYYSHFTYRDELGQISLSAISDNLYSFRGYLSVFSYVLFDLISGFIGVKMIYIYFIFESALIGLCIAYAAPMLYDALTNKKTCNGMCIILYLLFFMFWRDFMFYTMSDIPAVFFSFIGIAFFFYYFLKKSTQRILLFGGLFLGAAIAYRVAYKYVAYLFFFVIIIHCILQSRQKKVIVWEMIKKIIFRTVVFLAGMLIILSPQLIINMIKGHATVFPYMGEVRYNVSAGVMQSFTWGGFHGGGMSQYQFGARQYADRQFANIIPALFNDRAYTLWDAIYVLLSHPLDYIQIYIKKLFWVLSAGYEIVKLSPIPTFQNTVCVLFNYFLLGNIFAYIINIFQTNFSKKRIGFVYGCLFVSTTAIQNLVHVERRYYLIGYILLYFFNAFLLFEKVQERQVLNNRYKYYSFLTLYIFVSFVCRNTIRYNFL